MNNILAMAILAAIPVVLAPMSSSAAMAAADANAVREGKQIYADNCSTCHGDQLRNTSGGVTFDLRKLKPDEHDRFVHSVLSGKNDMPPWQGVLEPDQIEGIWAYIRATVDQ
jgi:mono/diheme cytochrome c family protein